MTHPPAPPRTRRRLRLTDAQLDALIQSGRATPERAQHDDILIEAADAALTGRVVIARQALSTPIRKLLDAGAITHLEADAARALRHDHDMAYAAGRNVLAVTDVIDGNSGGGGTEGRLVHAQRYRRALAALGDDLASVAVAGIVEARGGTQASYLAIGQAMMPGADRAEARGAGKAALVLAARSLAVFYGYRRGRLGA